jgi:hypothetical protein
VANFGYEGGPSQIVTLDVSQCALRELLRGCPEAMQKEAMPAMYSRMSWCWCRMTACGSWMLLHWTSVLLCACCVMKCRETASPLGLTAVACSVA